MVYDIHVKNNAANTTHAVIVDPGNGKILYNQQLPPFFSGGIGHFRMFGQGKMGPWFGGYGGQRGFCYHSGMTMGQSVHQLRMSSIPTRV